MLGIPPEIIEVAIDHGLSEKRLVGRFGNVLHALLGELEVGDESCHRKISFQESG
jgi:hypothetical protein